jgi:hypothetical protein
VGSSYPFVGADKMYKEVIFGNDGKVELNGFDINDYELIQEFLNQKIPEMTESFSVFLRDNRELVPLMIRSSLSGKTKKTALITAGIGTRMPDYNNDSFIAFLDTMFTHCMECRLRMYCVEKFIGSKLIGKMVLAIMKLLTKSQKTKHKIVKIIGLWYNTKTFQKWKKKNICVRGGT